MKIRLLRDKLKNFGKMIQQTMFLICLIGVAMISFPQNGIAEKYPIESEKISLSEALHRISIEYQIFFSYDQEAVQDIEVNYEPKRYENIEHALNRILTGTSLQYKIFNNRYIILYESSPEAINSLKDMVQHLESVIDTEEKTPSVPRRMPILSPLPARFAALSVKPVAFTVLGTVTDDTGEPLIGVNIQVKGSNKGTATDFDGRFTLEDIDENAVLVISYIGYQTREVSVAGKSDIEIVMVTDSQMLEEVVVVGYGTQKKVNLIGAVSSVDSRSFENRAITSTAQGLQGLIPNLNISPNNGSLGQAANINVRGYNSINGGEPLVLVDGVPSDINLIDPSDIESVSVLKDGASAAIYGARAAYGVVLITTKKGAKGNKPKVKLSSIFSNNSPTSKIDFIDSKERIEFMNARQQHTNGNNYYDEILTDAILAHYNDPSQPSSIQYPLLPGIWYPVGNENWQEILMNESYPMQQYNVSVSGGSDKFGYYTSGSFLNQKGLTNKELFDENYKRYNFLTKLDYDVTDWVHINSKISFNQSDKRFPPNDPWAGNIFPEGGTIYFSHLFPNLPYKDPNGNWSSLAAIPNLAQVLSEGGSQKRTINDVLLSGNLSLTPSEHFSFNLDLAHNIIGVNENSFFDLIPHYDVNGNVYTYYAGSTPNRVIKSHSDIKRSIVNAYGTYSNTIADLHNIYVLLGFNQEFTNNKQIRSERRNLILSDIPFMNLATGDQFANDAESEYALRGSFFRVNYSYNDKYLMELNGRYDGTSKFPRNDRFSFFPSISAGWRIDKERFFDQDNPVFDLLKIRGSYGALGNQNVPGEYPYIASMNAGQVSYILNGELPMGITSPGLISPTLTWETVYQWNFGLDASVLKGRLNASFDLYQRQTKDMLTKSRLLPAVLAVSEPLENAADLKNKGFDLEINWKDRINDFSYSITGLLSDFQGQITRFDNPAGLINDFYVGQNLGEIWGYKTGGIFQSDEEAKALDQSDITGRVRSAGDIWFVDQNGDGKITRGNGTLDDPGDMTIIGNDTPRFSFGLDSYIQWKNFDLRLFLQGVGKRDLWMSTLYFLDQYTAEWGAIPKIAIDYWTPENPDAYFPTPFSGPVRDITSPQTRFLQDASYIRLKQLNLGYQLPSNIGRTIGMDRIRIYFSGSNLLTFTKMVKISDPELSGPSAYPLFKSLSFGIDVEF